ncbi:Emopamil binding protein-domain-containing protein [Chytriomyces sp. MP71]|nr:Emopamil binding protein-domain-containing protein [Chytriomyces sp. MP71]
MAISHPFYPRNISIPNYTPAHYSNEVTLAIFFSWVFSAIGLASYLITRKTACPRTRLVFIWWVACAFIHGIVEGYFAWTNRTIAGDQTVLSAVWKEYALSDSRYMTSDSFVVVMEGITGALWGPLSLVNAYLIYKQDPARHVLQVIVSLGQLYGLIIYYITEYYSGFDHSSPAFLHFYIYFWGFNAPWFFIPIAVIRSNWIEIVKACRFYQAAMKKDSEKAKRN